MRVRVRPPAQLEGLAGQTVQGQAGAQLRMNVVLYRGSNAYVRDNFIATGSAD